jgi:pyridoxamine 5'-phosphate oxidase
MSKSLDLAQLRRDYKQAELLENSIHADPLQQFKHWFQEALEAEVIEPNAMCLSTVLDQKPHSRVVLLKGLESNGFVFFTNYASHKGQQLLQNPNVALNFLWLELERQVRINGKATPISAQDSDAYFYSRPFESQVGAIVSQQSHVLASREELEQAMSLALQTYSPETIKRPEHWGGYLVVPESIEFWQGRSSRLHDRLHYELQSDQSWKISRLSP